MLPEVVMNHTVLGDSRAVDLVPDGMGALISTRGAHMVITDTNSSSSSDLTRWNIEPEEYLEVLAISSTVQPSLRPQATSFNTVYAISVILDG